MNTENVVIVRVELDVSDFDGLGVFNFLRWPLCKSFVPYVDFIFVGGRDEYILGLWHPKYVLDVAYLLVKLIYHHAP